MRLRIGVSVVGLLLLAMLVPPHAAATYEGQAGHAKVTSYNCYPNEHPDGSYANSGWSIDVPSGGAYAVWLWVPYYLEAPGWSDEAYAQFTLTNHGGASDYRVTGAGPISGSIGIQVLVYQGDVVYYYVYVYYHDWGSPKCSPTFYGAVNIV